MAKGPAGLVIPAAGVVAMMEKDARIEELERDLAVARELRRQAEQLAQGEKRTAETATFICERVHAILSQTIVPLLLPAARLSVVERTNRMMATPLRVSMEMSNELWDGAFPQTASDDPFCERDECGARFSLHPMGPPQQPRCPGDTRQTFSGPRPRTNRLTTQTAFSALDDLDAQKRADTVTKGRIAQLAADRMQEVAEQLSCACEGGVDCLHQHAVYDALKEAVREMRSKGGDVRIAKLAADRVQERALALEGRSIDQEDYPTKEWLTLAAAELRRVERELRAEG